MKFEFRYILTAKSQNFCLMMAQHFNWYSWPYQLVNSTGRYIAKNVCSSLAWNPRWTCSTRQGGCKKYHFPKEPPGNKLRKRYVSRYKICENNNLMASKLFVYTRYRLQKQDWKILLYSSTTSLGTLAAPTSSWRPVGRHGCLTRARTLNEVVCVLDGVPNVTGRQGNSRSKMKLIILNDQIVPHTQIPMLLVKIGEAMLQILPGKFSSRDIPLAFCRLRPFRKNNLARHMGTFWRS